MINLISKVIRRLIEMDLIGNRFLGLVNTGIYYDSLSRRIYQKVGDEKVYLARCSHGVPRANGLDMIEWLNTITLL